MALDSTGESSGSQVILDYTKAHERLQMFANESVGWDGCG